MANVQNYNTAVLLKLLPMCHDFIIEGVIITIVCTQVDYSCVYVFIFKASTILPCSWFHNGEETRKELTSRKHVLEYAEKKLTYQGSNSCIMLSNRMTANKRELNPTSQARVSITNVNKLCKPPGFHIVERMSVFTPASAMLIYASFRHVILVSQSNFGKCQYHGVYADDRKIAW